MHIQKIAQDSAEQYSNCDHAHNGLTFSLHNSLPFSFKIALFFLAPLVFHCAASHRFVRGLILLRGLAHCSLPCRAIFLRCLPGDKLAHRLYLTFYRNFSYQMIMNFNDRHWSCHAERVSRSPERSEGEASLRPSRETLRGVYP